MEKVLCKTESFKLLFTWIITGEIKTKFQQGTQGVLSPCAQALNRISFTAMQISSSLFPYWYPK